MNIKLSKDEKDELLKDINQNGSLMPTEEFITKMIKAYMEQGNSYETAKKIVDKKCKEYGII